MINYRRPLTAEQRAIVDAFLADEDRCLQPCSIAVGCFGPLVVHLWRVPGVTGLVLDEYDEINQQLTYSVVPNDWTLTDCIGSY